jgi:hypothetical protein
MRARARKNASHNISVVREQRISLESRFVSSCVPRIVMRSSLFLSGLTIANRMRGQLSAHNFGAIPGSKHSAMWAA